MNYKKRVFEYKLSECGKFFKIVLLTGARQVGKSTTLEHLFPHVKSFMFDAIKDTYRARKNPDIFLRDQGIPLILDEIQYAPELLPSLKRFADQAKIPGQYYLTGSAQLSLLKTVSESLAGRVAIIPAYPMIPQEMYGPCNFEETWFVRYLQSPDTFFKDMPTKFLTTPLRPLTIWRGGMPGILSTSHELIPTYFASYIQTYLERDVRLIEPIEDLGTFTTFLRLVAALTAQEINYSQLGRELGLSPQKARKWLQILKTTYLWTELPPFHMNAIKRLSQKPKGLMTDTGLACYLQYITSPDMLSSSPLFGAMFETYCFNMLRGMGSVLPMPPDFFHWRTLAGAKVDLVIQRDNKIFPIEIKATAHITARDLSGLKAFKETYAHLNVQTAVVIYGGDTCHRVAEDIVAVPWNMI